MGWKVLRWAVGAVVAFEFIYVVAINALLQTNVIQKAASMPVEDVSLEWDSAYSPWPGRAYVTGFRLRLQDPLLQFRLTVASAEVDVAPWDLLKKNFHATHVRAEGVSFRFRPRSERTLDAGTDTRIASFPPIEGLPSPGWLPEPKPPPFTEAFIDSLWSVNLEDVHATLSELWLMEARYRGAGRVDGRFAFSPLRTLAVETVVLQLQGGELSIGDLPLAPELHARLQVAVALVDLGESPGLRVLQALTASLKFETPISNLASADLYLEGARFRGTGLVKANVDIAGGHLSPSSTAQVRIDSSSVVMKGIQFNGDVQAALTISDDTLAPTVAVNLTGVLNAPLFPKDSVTAVLSDSSAKLVFSGNRLADGLTLSRMSAVVGEARVTDTRAITRFVTKLVPVVAPIVMGYGTLLASVTAYVTPEYTLVRLQHLRMGDVAIEGAAVPSAQGWNGAFYGNFGIVPVGLRLRDDKLVPVMFPTLSWLGTELTLAGIHPE